MLDRGQGGKYGVAGFADSLPLLRELRKNQHPLLLENSAPIHSVSLGSVYRHLFGADFPAHDAEEDVKALRRVVFESPLAITAEQLLSHSVTTTSISKIDVFYGKKHVLLLSMKGKLYHQYKEGPVTKGMASKIAESGLGYSDLQSIFSKYGRDGIATVFLFLRQDQVVRSPV